MEQAGHITSVRILELGLAELRLRRPQAEIHLLQPDSRHSSLAGPSMGFEASRAALRYGYTSMKEWLGTSDADALRERFGKVHEQEVVARPLSFLKRAGKGA